MARATDKSTQPPRLSPSSRGRLETADALLLRAGDQRDGESFADADLTEVDLTGISFIECELENLTLTGAQLRGARFVESLLTAPFAPVLQLARSTWRDVRIDNPRWGSAELFDAEIRALHLRGGKIDYLNLRGAQLTDVIIEDCVITELDLGGAKCSRVAFADCRIGTIDLAGASCENVDLRSTDFSQINGLDGMRGITVDHGQLSLLAPVFAAHLGVRVE